MRWDTLAQLQNDFFYLKCRWCSKSGSPLIRKDRIRCHQRCGAVEGGAEAYLGEEGGEVFKEHVTPLPSTPHIPHDFCRPSLLHCVDAMGYVCFGSCHFLLCHLTVSLILSSPKHVSYFTAFKHEACVQA